MMNAQADRSYLWLFWLLAVVGLAADQASKYVVFARLYPPDHLHEERAEVFPRAFDLVASYSFERETGDGVLAYLRTVSGERLPHVNHGALFGIGSGMNVFFAGVSLLAALGITYWTSRPAVRGDRVLCFALGLILAGTVGNLYDRIVFDGVRDFLHWYGGFDWPVFNVADCCLVCGAGLLLVHAFFTEEAPTDAAAREGASPAVTSSTTANGL